VTAPSEPPARVPGAQGQPPVRRPDAVAAVAVGAAATTARPADGQPASRLPTAEVAPRPKPVASVERRVAQPGDRICWNCGEPNDPSRKFCRRCGTSLVEAKVVAAPKVPWYRRLFRREPKPATQMAAGDRIGSMQAGAKQGVRGLFKLRTLAVGGLAILVGIGVLGYVGLPGFQKYVNEFTSGGVPGILNRVQGFINPKQVIVRPVLTSVVASDEVDGHPATQLFDGVTNSDWQANGKNPTVTAKFATQIDLLSVYVHNGVAGKDFVNFRRPSQLQFSFPDGTTKVVDLQDVHDKQLFEMKASGIDTVTIKVLATNGPANAPVSISEIEFFKNGSDEPNPS